MTCLLNGFYFEILHFVFFMSPAMPSTEPFTKNIFKYGTEMRELKIQLSVFFFCKFFSRLYHYAVFENWSPWLQVITGKTKHMLLFM